MYHPGRPDGNYQTANKVHVLDPPRAIGWLTGYDPKGGGHLEFGGWFWRYDLAPLGPSAPAADKPTVVFRPPADADRVSHAMTLRVADCQAAYGALRSRGAAFLTPPHDWGAEIRCFLRDPDGHLVEISQSSQLRAACECVGQP